MAVQRLEKVLRDGGIVGKDGRLFPLPLATVSSIRQALDEASRRESRVKGEANLPETSRYDPNISSVTHLTLGIAASYGLATLRSILITLDNLASPP